MRGKIHEETVLASAIIHLLLVIVGIPWNIIVLITIFSKCLFKQPTYILLLNLVVADLLNLCFLFFIVSSNITQEFALGNSDYSRCPVSHTVVISMISLNFVSYYTLTLMSIDRLIYLKWPLRCDKHSTDLNFAVLWWQYGHSVSYSQYVQHLESDKSSLSIH